VPTPPLLYDGWIDRGRQAPFRAWPPDAVVVPALMKGTAAADPEQVHVWHDLRHYHEHALRHFGASAARAGLPDLPDRPWLPPDAVDAAAPATFGLHAGAVACHAASSQGKKDWPLERFCAVFAACPEHTFAVLGGDARSELRPLPNVVDLRGRTSVRQALGIAASASLFLGVDSGLAHAAAIAGVPTVVVMPQATTGFFFPYPRAFGGQVRTVLSAVHGECAGCGGICVHEPIWRSRRRGFPCLRAVDVDHVVAALRAAQDAAQ
jgi:ADP-heptose:LPS heptosyltransferase